MNRDIVGSDDHFRHLFNSMQEGFAFHEVVFDDSGKPTDYRYIDVNPAFERLTGLSRDKVIGKTVREALPQIEEHWIETFCRVGTTGKPAELENYVRELDHYYRARAYSPERNKFVVVFEDVTEQRKALLELQKREEQLRVLFEASRAGILMVDRTGGIILANQRMAEMLGYSMDELLQTRYPDHVHPDQRNTGNDRMRMLIAGEIDHVATERHYIRKDGCELWGYLSGKRHADADGNFISLVGHITDITEIKAVEKALRSNEEKFRLLFESAKDGIFIMSAHGELIDLNSSFASMHGYSVEEMRSMKLSNLDTPETAKLTRERIERLMAGEALTFEVEHYRKDNRTIPLEVSANLVTINDEKCILGFHRDISDRKIAEMALRKSEQNFRAIIEVSPMPLAVNDDLGNITYLNKAFVNTIGYTSDDIPVLEKWWPLAYPDEQYRQSVGDTWVKHLEDAKRTGLPFVPMEINVACKDGSVRTFICSTAPLEESFAGSHLVIFYDISDRKRAEAEKLAFEQQFQQTQKLESLGILAGGIAHDFNNILMAIIGNADLALMRINKDSPATENLHRIEQAAAKAADLAKQMLAYSGKGKFIVENIDMNILLQEMLHMLEVSISKKALLRFNPYNHLPSVEVDATQMRQIIMNLVINASEAIGDRSGVIAISTGCMNCDRNYLKDVWLDENISEGLYVYFEIADTGCGMSKETMAKLFDPFFTTKFTGRGLGMAAVLGIVRGHKGAIKVYSEQDKGTSFKILLPASSRPAELFNNDIQHDDWKGSGTVLLVDDEETVRDIGSEMLKELGFDVITADDGREGLEQFKQYPDISFIILDLTMPHMDGEQCFRELRSLNPSVKVIMSSGFNEQEVTQKFVGKGLAGFIQKPYKLSVLQDAIMKIDLNG